jgi:hypothetical protein
MFLRRAQPWFLFAGLVAAISSQSATACTVCFGASDDAATKAISWAIIFLLGIVGGILGGLIAFMVYLGRRSSAYAKKEAAEQSLLKIDLSETEAVVTKRMDPSSLMKKSSQPILTKRKDRFDSSGTNYSQ